MLLQHEQPGSKPEHYFATQKAPKFELSQPPPRAMPFPPSPPDQEMPLEATAGSPLQVTAIDVERFAATPDGEVRQGLLGRNTFAALPGDRVQVTAKLSKPAYAFLIAYRPDGQAELCFPENEETPPPLTDAPRYPLASGTAAYGLSEETGLWAFAVVASEMPLPAYHDWREEHFHESQIWKPVDTLPAGRVWRDDGLKPVETLSLRAEQPVLVRSQHEALEGPEASIRGLTTSLRRAGQAEAVSVLSFRVAPAKSGK